MRIGYDCPKNYDPSLPIFNEEGRVTSRVINGLENLLSAYVLIAKKYAEFSENNPENFEVSKVLVVGSGTRNRIDSDLDLLLITERLDDKSADNMKFYLSMIFYTDREKNLAVDPYIRKADKYPERGSKDITNQVLSLVKKYNRLLKED